MDQRMIDDVIESFANAFLRCKKAGLEMAMLHGAHGHLVAQFLSPYSNKRTDIYGGCLENRARFAIECLDAIRSKVGKDFGIEYRISADELVAGGMHPDETIEFVKMIEDKIDLLHVSAGMCSTEATTRYMIQPMYLPHCINVHFAERFKKELKVPIVTVGSIATMEEAEDIVAHGQADMVAMARAILADPQVVNNARKGRSEDTRPCLRCWKCNGYSGRMLPIRCAVNPKLGKELQIASMAKEATARKVAIVGGGPAGMQAALSAAERGCESVIFEQSLHLGGKLVLAAGVEYKQDMRRYLHWLVGQVTKNPAIETRTGVCATRGMVAELDPDAVVVATGSEPIIPHFPGEELNRVVWFGDVDSKVADVGEKVLLVGGGPSGAETALQLAREGRQVTLADMGTAAEALSRWIKCLDLELRQNNVVFLFEHMLERITSEGAALMNRSFERVLVEADTIVLSLGFAPNKASLQEFEGIAPDTYAIGDCRKIGDVLQATHDGFNIASML